MKHIKIYSIAAAGLMCLGGPACNSLLDLTPPMNDVEDNFYKKETDMYRSLRPTTC